MANKIVMEKDADGNVIKEHSYDPKGNLIYTHINEWKNGRIVRKDSYDSNGNKTASFPYEYDENGNNISGTWFNFKNGILMKTRRVFNKMNQVIEQINEGKGTIATNRSIRTYDEKGRLIIDEYYGSWPDMAPVYTINEYDDTDFMTKSTTEDSSHNVVHYSIYKKNEFNKVAEYTDYSAEGKPNYTIKYYFDKLGNRIKSEHYDGKGNLLTTEK